MNTRLSWTCVRSWPFTSLPLNTPTSKRRVHLPFVMSTPVRDEAALTLRFAYRYRSRQT
jgi:hypothetical protein